MPFIPNHNNNKQDRDHDVNQLRVAMRKFISYFNTKKGRGRRDSSGMHCSGVHYFSSPTARASTMEQILFDLSPLFIVGTDFDEEVIGWSIVQRGTDGVLI